jgi:RNA polymerase sigma factor (sigma-70 family)
MRRVGDVELVDLMRRNPDAGLAAAYERYADRIHDYCRSILRDDADAADALQDTFLAASARIGQLRDPGRLRPWLYAIARNRSYKTLRQRQRQRPFGDLEAVVNPAEPLDARRLESIEARELVWEAAGGLEDKDRDVLDLHLRHGLDGADLATVLSMTPPQANQALHRMRERLNRSVGAALALRYGRSDCDELRTIVGADRALTPLLRKRVARHLERCDTCGEYRSAGATIFAAIPIVMAPSGVGSALLSTGAGGVTGEEAASAIDWDASGFPSANRSGSRVAGRGPDALRRVAGGPTVTPALAVPVRRWPARVAVGAVAAVLLFGGFALGRLLGDGQGELDATGVTTSTADQTTADPLGATTTSTSPTTSATTGVSRSATAPPSTTPSTPASTTMTRAPLPSLTFDIDRQAPSMTVTVDCSKGVRITATLVDALDPAPTGELEVVWPPSRTRPASAMGDGIYEILLQGDDLTGLDGVVDFMVSGPIVDASGNEAEVTDSVSCIFVTD